MDLYHESYSIPLFLFILHSCLHFLSFILSYSNMYNLFYFYVFHSILYSSVNVLGCPCLKPRTPTLGSVRHFMSGVRLFSYFYFLFDYC
jgi:hypothetical protein